MEEKTLNIMKTTIFVAVANRFYLFYVSNSYLSLTLHLFLSKFKKNQLLQRIPYSSHSQNHTVFSFQRFLMLGFSLQ